MILLVDGDILLYRMSFRHQGRAFGELIVDSVDEAMRDFDDMIEELKFYTQTKEVQIVLSDFTNFRKELVPTYKISRKTQDKPKLLPRLRALVEVKYDPIIYPNLEGDDVLGILSTSEPEKYIIASSDKDLMQIPGYHFNWKNIEEAQVVYQKPLDGLRFFYQQILSGDPTDGYYGVYGIGKVKARKLLKDIDDEFEMWEVVLNKYLEAGMSEDEAIQTARLAKILDIDHWDSKNEAPILWEPPVKEVKE